MVGCETITVSNMASTSLRDETKGDPKGERCRH